MLIVFRNVWDKSIIMQLFDIEPNEQPKKQPRIKRDIPSPAIVEITPQNIQVGQTYTLKQNNEFRGKVFSKKGEKIKIVSISGNAVIYETNDGRFPINKNEI